jgi:UPF0716 protein FxsA
MFVKLLFLFTIIPLAELALLIKIGQEAGLFNTIALVIITGLIGAALARSQGFGIIQSIQAELAQGQIPADSLIHAAFILAGALLLLTPGIITDIFGFVLLIPFTRTILKAYLKKYFRRKINRGEIHVNYKVED